MRLFFKSFLMIFFITCNQFIFDTALHAQMEYVEFQNNEGETRLFSRLVMGTDHLSQGSWVSPDQPPPTEEEVFEVLDEAARQGINLFDTAPIYVGGVENMLGKWRKSRVNLVTSNDFYITPNLNPDRKIYALSKGGFPYDLFYLKQLPAGCHSDALIGELKSRGIANRDAVLSRDTPIPLSNVPPGTYASHLYCDQDLMIQRISEELAHTCANLGCGIDVYLMHRDDGDAVGFKRVERPQTPVATILDALFDLQNDQKISIFGWSNWTTDRVNESLVLAKARQGADLPAINSPYFSLFEMSKTTIHALGVQVTHDEMMDPNFQKGIRIMPYSPLGGYSIFDKPDPQWANAKKDAREKFEANDPYWQNVYTSIFTDENQARFNRAVAFAREFNQKHGTSYTLDQFLNAYVLAHKRTDMLAIGALTVEQVRRTVGALALSKLLSEQDLEHLYRGKVEPTLGPRKGSTPEGNVCNRSFSR